MSIFALKSRVGIDLVCTVSYDAVRRLVGLPMGHMDAWDAKFGRIWPLEPGVRATLSPAHTHLNSRFFHLAACTVFKIAPTTSTAYLALTSLPVRVEPC